MKLKLALILSSLFLNLCAKRYVFAWHASKHEHAKIIIDANSKYLDSLLSVGDVRDDQYLLIQIYKDELPGELKVYSGKCIKLHDKNIDNNWIKYLESVVSNLGDQYSISIKHSS